MDQADCRVRDRSRPRASFGDDTDDTATKNDGADTVDDCTDAADVGTDAVDAAKWWLVNGFLSGSFLLAEASYVRSVLFASRSGGVA